MTAESGVCASYRGPKQGQNTAIPYEIVPWSLNPVFT